MVLDAALLQEKLIEAWKLRSDETSFSASLSPLVAECQSEEEFRTLFTSKYLPSLVFLRLISHFQNKFLHILIQQHHQIFFNLILNFIHDLVM